jgi:hypothetical protein
MTLEREYVEGSMSIRELCRSHDIKSWSAVSSYAKKHVWEDKRVEFRRRLRERETAVVTQRIAEARADIVEKAMGDAITVANRAIFAFLDSLEDRWVEDPQTGQRVLVPGQQIEAGDFVKIMQQIMVLNGQPTKREAHLGLTLTGELDPGQATLELLRDVAAAARSGGAKSGPVSTSPLPRSERARQVN